MSHKKVPRKRTKKMIFRITCPKCSTVIQTIISKRLMDKLVLRECPRCKESPQKCEMIIEQMKEKCDGSFEWVKMVKI